LLGFPRRYGRGSILLERFEKPHDELAGFALSYQAQFTNNLIVGRAAYETARRLYPNERVDYRNGAQIIARSDEDS
jgi:hypothetical protein